MQTIMSIETLCQQLQSVRRAGQRIGFVPTMGFLHEGHRALIGESVALCDITVVSIFINPTQFGPAEDFNAYPHFPEHDHRLCLEAGVDVLFVPDASEIYPPGFQTRVEPGPLAEPLCGAVRPGHFRGVATVVAKLFNLVQPDVAFFGQKDFQQCAVVRQMAKDLNLPVAIVTVPTVREADGLAMSSRNSYLSSADRIRARCLSRGLWATEAAFRAGMRDAAQLVAMARSQMTEVDRLQYLELREARTLEPVRGGVEAPAVLCVAAYVGTTRLIDNIILDTNSFEHADDSRQDVRHHIRSTPWLGDHNWPF